MKKRKAKKEKRPKKKPRRTVSAGGVVIHDPSGLVLVVSHRGDSISLPKGHVDEGETPEEAALREIEEETGIPREELRHVRYLGKYSRFRIGKGGVGEDRSELKSIRWYLYTTTWDGPVRPVDPNHPRAWWEKPATVARILTHPKDRKFFAGLLAKGALHG